jgi:PIN domain nuclease of toxin-antitoxin system
VLLWALGKSSKLNATVRAALESSDNEVLFSAASIWEVAIKASLGRVDFSVSPEDIVRSALASGFVELPVTSAAALKVAALPLHHRDPFDRLLVAQALTQPAALYTADGQLGVYSELVVDVR